MYRFLLKPKWIGFHLLCIFGIVLMVNLGIWQLHRLQSRKDFNAEVRARTAEPVVPVEEVVTDGVDPDDVQWRTVTATGTYLPDEQVVVVNRSQGGFSGVNVVTPLELADGTIVHLPEATARDALRRLANLDRRAGLLNRPAQIIDLRRQGIVAVGTQTRRAQAAPDRTPMPGANIARPGVE